MIRFQRVGRTNDPAFRIVLLEKERAAKTGRVNEQLGTYNPKSKALTLNEERVKYWIRMGAQPTDSIHNLLITKKVIEGKKVNALPKKTPLKKEEPVTETAAPTSEVGAPTKSVGEEVILEAPVVEETSVA